MGTEGSRRLGDTAEFEWYLLTQPSSRRNPKRQLNRALVVSAGEVCAFHCWQSETPRYDIESAVELVDRTLRSDVKSGCLGVKLSTTTIRIRC